MSFPLLSNKSLPILTKTKIQISDSQMKKRGTNLSDKLPSITSKVVQRSEPYLIIRRKTQKKRAMDLSYSSEEHDIYEESEDLPGSDNQNQLHAFLEQFKFRYERETNNHIACYDVIQRTKKLAVKSKKHYQKWFRGKQVNCIDFRDWTKNSKLNGFYGKMAE